MKISKTDHGKSIRLQRGEELEIQLEENSTTGFRWYQKEGEHSKVIGLRQAKHIEQSNAQGGGGVKILRLTANNTGAQQLKWVYWQEWNGDDSIADEFEIFVEVTE